MENTLLSILIKQFKEKDLSSIKYEYTEYEKDKATNEYMEAFYSNKLPEGVNSFDFFLRDQSEIFPVKTSSPLTFLCGLLYLYKVPILLANLKEIIEFNPNLILSNLTYVDNDKTLSWDIESPHMAIVYQNVLTTINFDEYNPNMDNHETDSLVLAVGDFIYRNVKAGNL